jgi:hypothetical protein
VCVCVCVCLCVCVRARGHGRGRASAYSCLWLCTGMIVNFGQMTLLGVATGE